jgi:S1-C subfamily serine protease
MRTANRWGMATAATAAVVVVTLICAVAAGRAAEISSGSGVVINPKGEILTNAHVVEGCQTITVRLAFGNSEAGVLVANDEKNDLAVVRVMAIGEPPTSIAVFREGAPVRPGDTIVALGYPLSGLLSSDANISVGNVSTLAGLRDDSLYLQISAPVQPGNSGGPLLDASGHLVGVVTAKLDAMRVARVTGDIPQNVNFALKTEREHFWTARILLTRVRRRTSNYWRLTWRRSGDQSPFLLSVNKLIPNPRLQRKRENRHRKRELRQCNIPNQRRSRKRLRLKVMLRVKHSRNCQTVDGRLYVQLTS